MPREQQMKTKQLMRTVHRRLQNARITKTHVVNANHIDQAQVLQRVCKNLLRHGPATAQQHEQSWHRVAKKHYKMRHGREESCHGQVQRLARHSNYHQSEALQSVAKPSYSLKGPVYQPCIAL